MIPPSAMLKETVFLQTRVNARHVMKEINVKHVQLKEHAVVLLLHLFIIVMVLFQHLHLHVLDLFMEIVQETTIAPVVLDSMVKIVNFFHALVSIMKTLPLVMELSDLLLLQCIISFCSLSYLPLLLQVGSLELLVTLFSKL